MTFEVQLFFINDEKGYKMSIPDWLRRDKEFIPSAPPDPEVQKAIRRYKEHFGKFDIDQVYFFSRETILNIIDYCIKSNKCYQELYPRDPNAIY